MLMFKKLLRTLAHYKGQFISMVIMIFLGVGIFVGFNGEWASIDYYTNKFFDETNVASYYLYAKNNSFTVEDLNSIRNIEGINNASRKLKVNVNITIGDKDKVLSLNVDEDYIMSKNYIVDGEEYNKDSQVFYLNDKFAKLNNIALNSKINVSYNHIQIEGEVASFIKNPEYLYAVKDEGQVMPEFSEYGYCYISPKFLAESLNIEEKNIPYSMMIIDSNLTKDELESKINNALDSSFLLLSIDEMPFYSMPSGEIDEGKTMAMLLPFIFLLIAILTLSTTMNRITTKEKTQIGILKSLGFKNRRIIRHYTCLGTIVSLIGVILALPVGMLLTLLMFNEKMFLGTCFDMPYWGAYFPWWTYLVLILIVGFVSLISFLSTKKMLKGTASDTLRPYVIKNVKNLKIFNKKKYQKLSFATKWNLRDIFRNKARSLMAIFGVFCCMILLVASFGMRNSMDVFMNNLDTKIYNFESKVNISESANQEEVNNLKLTLNADSVSSLSITSNKHTFTLDIYDVSHDYIRVIDAKDKIVKIDDNGSYVCQRIADKLKLHPGDTYYISVFGSKETFELKVNAIVKSSLTETIFISKEYAETIHGINNNISLISLSKISYLLTNDVVDKDNNCVATIQLKKDVISSYNKFMEIMNLMIVILVLFAVLLSFVVLYNLGSMSYLERYRELATLKVIGFNNKKLSSLLIKQNVYLAIIGVILGAPSGYGILVILMKFLATEYELRVVVSFLSYCLAICITIVTALVVNYFVAKKNKKIDMVEALKCAE